MTLADHLRLAGTLLVVLALLHLLFPRRFGWRDDLAQLTLLNRQIFLVHVGFIMLTLALMGALLVGYTAELLTPSRLSRAIFAGLALFWGLRLIVQHAVYDRRLWLGHRTNTAVHVLFTLLWGYFATLFGWAWWSLR